MSCALQAAAALATLLGVALLADRSRAGWLVHIAGCAGWVWWGCLAGAWFLVGLNVALATWGAWGWAQWRREGEGR